MKSFVIFVSLGLGMLTALVSAEETAVIQQSERQQPCLVFLYGPPGSGRSKVAIKIQQNFPIPHISFAELLNQYAQEETNLAQSLHTYLNEGGEIPQDLFIEIFKKRLANPDCAQGCLIEGAPWTVQQARVLYDTLQKDFLFLAINIDVQDQLLLSKAQGRFVCTNCGRVYQESPSSSRTPTECATCHTLLTRRHDDSLEIMQAKLETYRTTVLPVLAFFEEKKALVLVEGDKTLDSIYYNVFSSLTHRANWK